MEGLSEKDVVYSKGVIEFLTVANEFCLFTEKTGDYKKEDIINYMLKVCPLVYLKGALLPECGGNDSEITERYVTEEHWESVYNAIKSKLGKDDIYWIISANDYGENAPAMASISENLADIYQDLKDFIMLYHKGTQASKENAVSECVVLFKTHWGSRIVNAHRALHHIIYTENLEDDFYENGN